MKSFENTERIGEILRVKVTSQFTRRNPVIWNSEFFNQFTFDSIIGTDIRYLISGFFKCRNQGYVWGDMSGSTTAGKNNMLHGNPS